MELRRKVIPLYEIIAGLFLSLFKLPDRIACSQQWLFIRSGNYTDIMLVICTILESKKVSHQTPLAVTGFFF